MRWSTYQNNFIHGILHNGSKKALASIIICLMKYIFLGCIMDHKEFRRKETIICGYPNSIMHPAVKRSVRKVTVETGELR
jgi:hypothetical protein